MPWVRFKNDPNRREFVTEAERFRLAEAGEIIEPYDPERPGFMPLSANANRHGVADVEPERTQWSGDTIYQRQYQNVPGWKPEEE